jgi:hypothetical protein
MCKKISAIIFLIALGLLPGRAQNKPMVMIHLFTLPTGVNFPYDMSQLRTAAMDELKSKYSVQFDVTSDSATTQARAYTVDGEVLE